MHRKLFSVCSRTSCIVMLLPCERPRQKPKACEIYHVHVHGYFLVHLSSVVLFVVVVVVAIYFGKASNVVRMLQWHGISLEYIYTQNYVISTGSISRIFFYSLPHLTYYIVYILCVCEPCLCIHNLCYGILWKSANFSLVRIYQMENP